MKRILILLLLVVVVLAGITLALRDMLAKKIIHQTFKTATGFGLEMEDMDLGLLKSELTVEGLRLLNPPDFPEPTAVEMTKFYLDYDFLSLFGDEPRFRKVVFDVARVTVVCDKQGRVNFDELAGLPQPSGRPASPLPERPMAEPLPVPELDAEPEPATRPSRPQRIPEVAPPPVEQAFRIDDLTMRIEQVTYLDYSGGGAEPAVFTVSPHIEVHLQDVTDPAQIEEALAGQMFAGMLGDTDILAGLSADGLKSLATEIGIDGEQLEAVAGDVIAEVGAVLEEMADDPNSELNQLLGALMGGEAGEDSTESGTKPAAPSPSPKDYLDEILEATVETAPE